MIVGIVLVVMMLSGCNSSAKRWGGTTTVELPTNQKLVNVSWKDDSLWYLTRQMRDNEKAETFEYVEKSQHGIIEGKVIFSERKGE